MPEVRHSPLISVRSFALEEQEMHGTWPEDSVSGRPQPFVRLESDACEYGGLKQVAWALRGELRRPLGGEDEVWLHLRASAATTLVCQRCLGPATVHIEAERSFRFVADEETAAMEDDDCEEDVLGLEDPFDWVALVEDELIMATPLVPMHEACPNTHDALSSAVAVSESTDRTRPFADLKALLQPDKGG